MSRTFTAPSNGVTLFDSAHNIRPQAIERASLLDSYESGTNAHPHTTLVFDLVDSIRDIQVKRLHDDVLSRLSFAADGYIQGALSRLLASYYKHSKADEGAPTFETYDHFLRHVESTMASEQALYEAGMDVTPEIERILTLANLRNELHCITASQLRDPLSFIAPSMDDVLMNPRMRSLTAQAEAGLIAICEDDTDDVELRAEMLAQYKMDDQSERANQFRMDKIKAKSLVMLWNCVSSAQGDVDREVISEDDAFFTLDARTQLGLLNCMMRAVVETRRRAVIDNRLSVLEKAALRVEAKALIASLTIALTHHSFTDIDS